MTGSVPCPICGLPVPQGRLACPSCGALVASVAHGDTAAPTAPAPTYAPAGMTAAPSAAPSTATQTEPVDTLVAADAVASGGIVPGSYVPPSTVHRPAPPSTPGPYALANPEARPATPGWVPPTPYGSLPGVTPTPALTSPPPPAASSDASPAGRPLTPGRSSILADLPFDAPDELEGWLVTLGGGLAILGFFLPWTSSLATGIEGYFGSWGLGIGAHLPIFLFLVVVTALAVLPNRVATWVRTGVCGMVGGGILFGVVWLYLGSDASQLGALLAAVGAIVMVAGGIISVAPGRSSRHPDED
jgi:hypothetical protein